MSIIGEIELKNFLIKLNSSLDSSSALKSYKRRYNKAKLTASKKIKSTVIECQRITLKTKNAI